MEKCFFMSPCFTRSLMISFIMSFMKNLVWELMQNTWYILPANKRSCYLSQYNVPQKRQFLQLPHRVPFAWKGGLWQSCVLYFLSKYSLRVTTEIHIISLNACQGLPLLQDRCCSTRNCQKKFSGARFYGSSGNKHSSYC